MSTVEIEPELSPQPLAAAVAIPRLGPPRVRTLPARATLGRLALGGVVLSGLAVGLGAPRTRFLVLAGDGPPLPRWIMGPFAGVGWGLQPVLLCVLLAAMIACYLAVLRWDEAVTTRAGLSAVLALHAIFLLAPPLLSSDVFNYIDAGRLHALYGLNPYVATPLARATDVAFPFTGAPWTHSASVYGPAFVLLSSLLAPLGVAAQLWALKALAALSSLGCVALIWACARRRGRPPLHAAMFFGLNPIVLVLGVGGAHNDLLMSVLVLLALWLALADRARLAVTALVAAVAVKLTAVLVLPFLLIASGARSRHAALTSLGAFALLAAGAFALFGTAPLHSVATLGAGGARHVGELRSVPGFLAGYAGIGPIGSLARGVLGVVCLGAIAAIALLAARGRIPWLTAACWSVLVLLLSSTRLEPWYAVWLIPLAAVSADRRVRAASHWVLVGIALIGLARYALRLGIAYPHGG
jgi:alpha-1,6-mannosyltransferase